MHPPAAGAEQGERAADDPAVAAGHRACSTALPAIGPFVFSSRGDKPFGNISHSKAQLDALIARQRAEARLGRELAPSEQPDAADALPPWRLARSAQDRRDRPAAAGRAAGGHRGRARARLRQPSRHRRRLSAPPLRGRGARGAGRLGRARAAADRRRDRRRRGGAAAPRVEFPSWGRLGLAAESGFRSHPPAAPSHPRTAPADGCADAELYVVAGDQGACGPGAGDPYLPDAQRRRYPSASRPVVKELLADGIAVVEGIPRDGDLHEPIPAIAWRRIKIVFLESRPKIAVRDGRQGAGRSTCRT